MFAGGSAASKKNESSQGGKINRIDTIGELMSNGGKLNTMKSIIPEENGTETGLKALVMEHGMKRRKSIYEEVKPLEKRDVDFILNLNQKNQKHKSVIFQVHGRTVMLPQNSLFILGKENRLRKVFIWLYTWRWFVNIITACILLNSLCLALFDYQDRDALTPFNNVLEQITQVFTYIFCGEALIKIIAMGFVLDQRSYLRDTWNAVDFVIVIAGLLEIVAVKVNLKPLRVLRVIRPLRSVKASKTIRKQVSTLLSALPELGNATIFILFTIILFSILGLQQFQGVMHFRCRLTEKPVNSTYWPKSELHTRICSIGGDGAYQCPPGLYCGSPSQFGMDLNDDEVWSSVFGDYGLNNFDNFGQAFLAVFQTITGDQWSSMMYNLMDGYTIVFTQGYFCILVILGHFYIMQLLLAVILSNLSKITQLETFNSINKQKLKVQKDLNDKKKEDQKRLEELGKAQVNTDGTPNHFRLLMLAVQEKKAQQQREADELKRQKGEEEKKMKKPPPGKRMTLSQSQMMGHLQALSKERIKESSNNSSKSVTPASKERKITQQKEEVAQKTPTELSLAVTKDFKKPGIQDRRGGIQLQLEAPQKPQKVPQSNKSSRPGSNQRISVSGHRNSVSSMSSSQRKMNSYVQSKVGWQITQGPPLPSQQSALKPGGQAAGATSDLSKGIGLALLSKVLGIEEINTQFSHLLEKIKRTKQLKNLEVRLKLQTKLSVEICHLQHKLDLNVVKMYWKSKKNVYGIDNEVHLVEQIQKFLNDSIVMMNLRQDERITHEIIEEVFDYQVPYLFNNGSDASDEAVQLINGPQLDLHMLFTLKISYNLKDMAYEQNVKNFFFSRFKRRLFKKNIVDKLSLKVKKYINQTVLEQRIAENFVFAFCYKIVSHIAFQIFGTTIICVNTLVLGLERVGLTNEDEQKLEYANLGFFSFFVVELVLKLFGQGFKHYLRDRFNWFDGSVVLLSAIDITLTYSLRFSESGSGAITALRVLRLVRIFQLLKNWKTLQELLQVMIGTIKDLSVILLLICLLLYIYMLIGMELFAYKLPHSSKIESSFDGVLNSFITVFIIFANDGWSQLYFAFYKATEPISTSLYFLSLLSVGQYILLNLLIAIIIENFEYLSVKNDLINKIDNMKKDEEVNKMSMKQRLERVVCFWKKKPLKMNSKKIQSAPSADGDEQQDDKPYLDIDDDEYFEILRMRDLKLQQRPSLNFFEFRYPLRAGLRYVIETQAFEYVMIFSILLSSITLALDNPLNDPKSEFSIRISKIDMFCTVIFIFEAAGKIVTYGLWECGSKSYFKSGWNILDFLVITLTVLQYLIGETKTDLKTIKIFRLIKVLRPLRALSKNEGLKISINALRVALPEICQISILSILFYFMFGVIGINYFKGQFWDCSEENLGEKIVHKWHCLNLGGHWQNHFLNFDSTPNAVATLFVMSNTVQWAQIMYRASKIVSDDYSKADEIQNPYAPFFFIAAVVIGNFFLINLFIGVIITKYNREKELAGKDFMLTDHQKQWVQTRMMLLHSQPLEKMSKPKQEWRQPFFYLAESKMFLYFILICIVLNSLMLGIQWYNQPKYLDQAIESGNYFFMVVFTVELIVNLTAYGFRYFQDSWRIFDIIIITLSWLGIILAQQYDIQLGPQMTIIKSFRIARILFFFRGNRTLKGTIMTFFLTLPAMTNLGSLLLLVILVYAILGMNLFAEVKLNGILGNNENFQTVASSFVTMIRILTGEDWPELMQAVSRSNDSTFICTENPSYTDFFKNGSQPVGCGDPIFSVLFFYSYVLLVAVIFMRVFIAIVVQTFQTTAQKESKFLSSDLSEHFRIVWSLFDPNATSFLPMSSYSKFLLALGEPLGWDITYNHNYIKQMEYLKEVALPRYNQQNDFYFTDVFEHLVLIMIIRREVFNYAMKNNMQELLNTESDKLLQEYENQLEMDDLTGGNGQDGKDQRINGRYSLQESSFVKSPEKVMPYPKPLQSQQVKKPEKVQKQQLNAVEDPEAYGKIYINGEEIKSATNQENVEVEQPIKIMRLSQITETQSESSSERSYQKENSDIQEEEKDQQDVNIASGTTNVPNSSQNSQMLKNQNRKSLLDMRMMRHNHYGDKFYQDESPKNDSKGAKANKAPAPLLQRHLTQKDQKKSSYQQKPSTNMKIYEDEQFISYSYRRHYDDNTGKKILQNMNEHFRDQDRRFNDKDLEEQDEKADEDILLYNDIEQIEEELRRQELNHDLIVREEMRKYDQDAQHQV